MDRIRVSEALDTGSIPVGRTMTWVNERPYSTKNIPNTFKMEGLEFLLKR